MSRELIEITYDKRVNDTPEACLYDIAGEKVWLPKSQIMWEDEEDGVVCIPEWLAFEKGLI